MEGPFELSDDAISGCLSHIDQTTENAMNCQKRKVEMPSYYMDMISFGYSKADVSALFSSQRAFVTRTLKKLLKPENFCKKDRGFVPKWKYGGPLMKEYAEKHLRLSVFQQIQRLKHNPREIKKEALKDRHWWKGKSWVCAQEKQLNPTWEFEKDANGDFRYMSVKGERYAMIKVDSSFDTLNARREDILLELKNRSLKTNCKRKRALLLELAQCDKLLKLNCEGEEINVKEEHFVVDNKKFSVSFLQRISPLLCCGKHLALTEKNTGVYWTFSWDGEKLETSSLSCEKVYVCLGEIVMFGEHGLLYVEQNYVDFFTKKRKDYNGDMNGFFIFLTRVYNQERSDGVFVSGIYTPISQVYDEQSREFVNPHKTAGIAWKVRNNNNSNL